MFSVALAVLRLMIFSSVPFRNADKSCERVFQLMFFGNRFYSKKFFSARSHAISFQCFSWMTGFIYFRSLPLFMVLKMEAKKVIFSAEDFHRESERLCLFNEICFAGGLTQPLMRR